MGQPKKPRRTIHLMTRDVVRSVLKCRFERNIVDCIPTQVGYFERDGCHRHGIRRIGLSRIRGPSDYLIGSMGVGGTGLRSHMSLVSSNRWPNEHYPDFGLPNQKSWVFGPAILLTVDELFFAVTKRPIGPGSRGNLSRTTGSMIFVNGKTAAGLEHNRQADQVRPYAMLPGDQRVIETAIIGGEERIFIKDLDGENAVELTRRAVDFITLWRSITMERVWLVTSPEVRPVFITQDFIRLTCLI